MNSATPLPNGAEPRLRTPRGPLSYALAGLSLLLFSCTGKKPPSVAGPEAPPIIVELRLVPAHGITDAWGRATNLSCVVTNHTRATVTVQIGYDGTDNQILATPGDFPLLLQPWSEKRITRTLRVPPGGQETLFTLPLHGILLLGTGDENRLWQWSWAGSAPRGAPPQSPVHLSRAQGWQAFVADETTLVADVLVDSKRWRSAPFSWQVPHPPTAAEGIRNREFALTAAADHAAAMEDSVLKVDTAVITGAQVVAYHWPSHSLHVEPGVIPRLRQHFGQRLEQGVPFQLQARGVTVYTGTFIQPDARPTGPGPVIRLHAHADAILLQVENPHLPDGPRNDVRNGPRLYTSLLAAGLVRQ